MRVFITGGTGLIGRRLVERLRERGDQPVVLSRHADRARLKPAFKGVEVVQGDPVIVGGWERGVEGCDAAVHLAGHNLFAERWSPEVLTKIRDSRVFGTENLVAAMARSQRPPGVLVSGSAIGYYGSHGDEELIEESPPGDDFMASVCRQWEDAARPAESLGTRVVTLRTGIVLDRGEGALGTMVPIFKWVPGGAAPIGSDGGLIGRGRQWMSWIHREDIVGLILLAIDHPEARGALNGTAPNPVRNVDFSRALAKAVHRPFVPFGPPDALLKLALGDVTEILATGQRVLSRKAGALGYPFEFPTIEAALADLFGRKAPAPKTDEPAPAAR